MSAKPNMSARPIPPRAPIIPLRPISFGTPAVHVERRGDGTIYLRPKAQLLDYPCASPIDCIIGPRTAPDRVFMAERNGGTGLAADHPMRSCWLRRGT
jgi:feruloyl-CoA synthase